MQGLPSSATSLLSSAKMARTAGPPCQGRTLNAALTRLSCYTKEKHLAQPFLLLYPAQTMQHATVVEHQSSGILLNTGCACETTAINNTNVQKHCRMIPEGIADSNIDR